MDLTLKQTLHHIADASAARERALAKQKKVTISFEVITNTNHLFYKFFNRCEFRKSVILRIDLFNYGLIIIVSK